MKYVFAGVLILFAVLYAIALGTLKGPSDDGRVHLFWYTDPNPARKVQIELFSQLYPGATASVDRGEQIKLIVRCSTGTGPDIIDVYGEQQLQTYVEAGILLDLTPYARKMGFAPEKTYPGLKDALVVEGRQYRFPCNVWANCVIYNRAIFDDHGVAYPEKDWTWDDFIRIGKRLRETPAKSGATHLVVANYSNMWMLQDMLVGHGGRQFTDDGLTSMLDAPEAIAAMQLYHDLMHVHEVIPTPSEAAAMSGQGGWGTGGINWFSSGKAATIFIGRWYIIQVVNWPDIAPHLGAVLMPRVAGRPSQSMCDCRGAGINVNSPYREQALQFLQYLATRDYGRLIVHDGDSLPPNPDLARSGRDLVNQTVPDPAFHQPFVDALANARPLDLSPFIDASQVERWLRERLENVENRIQAPEEAMRDVAAEMNQQIRRNLERRPDLQRKYEAVTGRTYTADWWRTGQKH